MDGITTQMNSRLNNFSKLSFLGYVDCSKFFELA